MRLSARAVLWICIAGTLAFADKKPNLNTIVEGNAGNERVEITASVILDKDELLKEFGMDLPPGVIAAKVRVRLLSEEPLRLDIDDFTLVSHKDGQRSGPFSPTQLAGNSALKIKMQQAGGGGAMGQPSRGPRWGGGLPGGMGYPPLPGDGGMVGSATSTGQVAGGVESTGEAAKKKDSPLLEALKQKTLPSEEIKESTSGLLFFPLEGKHKPKDLSMIYKGPGGRLVISFGH